LNAYRNVLQSIENYYNIAFLYLTFFVFVLFVISFVVAGSSMLYNVDVMHLFYWWRQSPLTLSWHKMAFYVLMCH